VSIINSIDTELPIPIEDGGTGKTTRQESIDTLTDVASAEIGQILTKDSLGNVSFQNNSTIQSYLTTGTSPNYQVNIDSIPTSYTNGMIISIRIHEAYTATGQATIDVNGMGAKAIRIRVNDGSGSRNIYGYEMLPNVACLLQYDGSQFYLLNPQGGLALDTSWKSFLTSGTQPNYAVNIYPAPVSYTDGLTFDIQINDNLLVSTGATLNVNGMGAKDIKITQGSTQRRNPEQYELSRSCHYRVSYDASLDAFILQNPTFGGALAFFNTTVGSSSGTLTINSQDSRYAFLSGNTVYVQFNILLNLSGSNSYSLTAALPFTASSHSRNKIFGPMYINASTGESNWLGFAFISATGNTVNFYRPNTSANWEIDNNFLIDCWGIYQIA